MESAWLLARCSVWNALLRLLLTSLGLCQNFVSPKCYRSILEQFYIRTAVLIGLWVRSRFKRTAQGSHGAGNEQGGEGKELHVCLLRLCLLTTIDIWRVLFRLI